MWGGGGVASGDLSGPQPRAWRATGPDFFFGLSGAGRRRRAGCSLSIGSGRQRRGDGPGDLGGPRIRHKAKVVDGHGGPAHPDGKAVILGDVGPRPRGAQQAETPGGGSHVSGFERGLRALAGALAIDAPEEAARVLGAYVVAVVSVFHFKPPLAGPTRDRLATPEIEPLVESAVEACLLAFAASQPEEAGALVTWVLERDRRGW